MTPQTLPQFKILKHHQGVAKNLEIACIASHLKAVQQAFVDGHSCALIMEDDIRALHTYDYQQIVSLAPNDWEVLQLHVSNPKVVEYLGRIYGKLGAVWQEWERDHYSAGAYLINRRGMKKLIDLYLSEDGGQQQIDLSMIHAVKWVTAEFMLFKRTASYSITVPLFAHNPKMGSTVNPEKLPLYVKGKDAIDRVASSVRNELRRKHPDCEYLFVAEKREP